MLRLDLLLLLDLQGSVAASSMNSIIGGTFLIVCGELPYFACSTFGSK